MGGRPGFYLGVGAVVKDPQPLGGLPAWAGVWVWGCALGVSELVRGITPQSALAANWRGGRATALEGTKLWGVISAEVTGMVA